MEKSIIKFTFFKAGHAFFVIIPRTLQKTTELYIFLQRNIN